MERTRRLTFGFVAAAMAIVGAHCGAQTSEIPSVASYPAKALPSENQSVPYAAKPVPVVSTVAPFSTNVSPAAMEHFVSYRAQEQMSERDRALAGKAEPAIRDAAAFGGIDLAQGAWSYRQLDCEALPGHLLLLYTSGSGADVTLFSVTIARGGSGRVHVIPVERRGFSLYSPAPVNPLAIAAFNRTRAEETGSPTADWLATGLCYAALTEPRFEVSAGRHAATGGDRELWFPPSMEVGADGEATVRFVNIAEPRAPMQWALAFDAKGLLVGVEHFPTPVFATKIVE